MRWFSRTKFSKASWPPFWHSAIRSLSSGATITLIVNHLTILRDKSFETSVKLNAGRIEKLHPCSHHSHHREGAFPKLNRLVYNCRVGSKTIAPQPFTQENDITAVGILDELTKSVAKVVHICDFWCTIHQLAKHQIARRKHQTPSSREIRSFKFQKVHQPRSPEFGVWKLELLWDLELGSFSGVWSLVLGAFIRHSHRSAS